VRGTFEEFDVVNQWVFSASEAPDAPTRQWLALQKTNGPSDVYVQNNTWQPGGTTGWHTHPGHSLIIVTEGTITAYDESCVPVQYSAGATIVDEGGDHAHVLRNETGAIARTVAIQIVPVGPGVMRRIDADAPPSCAGVR
jgi:quercetin dioxygenase-like cupin family protein